VQKRLQPLPDILQRSIGIAAGRRVAARWRPIRGSITSIPNTLTRRWDSRWSIAASTIARAFEGKARSASPSRSRLSRRWCFNAGLMSRARKQAVSGILQVPPLPLGQPVQQNLHRASRRQQHFRVGALHPRDFLGLRRHPIRWRGLAAAPVIQNVDPHRAHRGEVL